MTGLRATTVKRKNFPDLELTNQKANGPRDDVPLLPLQVTVVLRVQRRAPLTAKGGHWDFRGNASSLTECAFWNLVGKVTLCGPQDFEFLCSPEEKTQIQMSHPGKGDVPH